MNDTSEHDNATDAQDLIGDDTLRDEADARDAFVAAPPAPVKSGVGWGVVLPLFLLAGLGGAVGGWALTQYVMPNYVALPQSDAPKVEPQTVDLAPLTRRIESLEKKLSAQSSELSFLSSEVKSGSASVTVGGVDKALDITPLLNRIDALETELKARPAAATIVNQDGAPVIDMSALEDYEMRLDVLEKTMSEPRPIDNALSENLRDEFASDVDSLRARIMTLEESVAEARALAAAPTVVRETVLLPRFPREVLLEAMTAPRDQDAQSWISQTLKKHISVRDPQEVARAEARLDEVDALIEAKEYGQALAIVEGMPSDVRSLASDWISAVKSEIQSR